MKKLYSILVLLTSLGYGQQLDWVRQVKQKPIVDVREFGAKGDGVTDDTASIQAALTAAAAASKTKTFSVGITIASVPKIYFPNGIYKLTAGLTTSGFARLEGESGAILLQTLAGATTITVNDANTVVISKLMFSGGANALWFKNDNLDGSMLTVEDSEFHDMTGWPIQATPLDGFNTSDPAHNHLSASLLISRCRFMYVPHALKSYADYNKVSDSWGTFGGSNVANNTAFFEIHGEWDYSGGRLYLDNFLGVPVLSGKTQVRWIDNYGSVVATKSRFGGEWGGIPIIYNYAGYRNDYPYIGHSVVITDSSVFAGTNRADGGVVVLKTALPGMIALRDNQGSVSVPYVNNVGIADLPTYLAAITYPTRSLRFTFNDNLPLDVPNPTTIPGTPNLYPAELSPYVFTNYWNPATSPTLLKARGYIGTVNALTRIGGRIHISIDAGNYFTWTQTDDNQTIVSYTPSTVTPTGMVITLVISRDYASSLGNPTFDTDYFTLSSAWTQPADGAFRSISFIFNGTKWIEISRT